jgi:hypothetical protein
MVSPRLHFFLWLLSKNKLLTRNNLEKRRHLDDRSYLFCAEDESVDHLFFECVVAKRAWAIVCSVIGFELGSDYLSIANMWLCNKKFGVINMLTSGGVGIKTWLCL